jgi:hypothetical protein
MKKIDKNDWRPLTTIWLLIAVLCLMSYGCSNRESRVPSHESRPTSDEKFPQIMVGTWQAPPGIQDVPGWQITFEKDGTISKMYHRIFQQPMIVKDGGVYKDGPAPGTYMVFTLGPVETEYDPVSKIIKAKIVVDNYEMKLPTGSLEGRMIDTLVGKASEDGQTWQAEWRNYGWLKGATEPNIAFIDKNPNEIIVFRKLKISDPNAKGQ